MAEHPESAAEPTERETAPSSEPWFAPRQVPEEQMIRGRIDRLRLWLAHRPGDWRLATLREPAPHDPETDPDHLPLRFGAPEPIAEPPPEAEIRRFPTSLPGDDAALRPLLADRPIVTRPEMPVIIPGEDRISLYVSTPLWLEIELLNPTRALYSMPITRPSDTWFGPNTRHGTVAYASRTSAHRELENLHRIPYRAITRVTVENRAKESFLLERLAIPAPSLTLYADRHGDLWTDSLTAVREPIGSLGQVEVSGAPPPEAEHAERVAEPRYVREPTLFRRALDVLLS